MPGGDSTSATGEFRRSELDPRDLGLAPARLEDLAGGDAATNADLARRVLSGERSPRRDIVLLNSAAGLLVGGRVADLAEGVALAGELIDGGESLSCLERFVGASRRTKSQGS